MLTQHLSAPTLVIGSGPGGAIAAAELQKNGQQVLIVEEGIGYDQKRLKPYSLSEMLRLYRNGGITTTFGNPAIKYVEGSCVGGGSEINSGMYYRTPVDIIDIWRDSYRVMDFTEQSLEPHFIDCEARVNVCYMPGDLPLSSLKLLEGANNLGWDCNEIPRWFRYHDKPNPNPTEGVRQSMSETYLQDFVGDGGKIISGFKVFGIKRRRQAWQAIGRYQDGTQLRISADRIIVAAGAIQTPAILRRSGFTKNIGNNLKIHTTAKVIAQFEEVINSETTGVPVHQIREFAPAQSFGCAVSTPAYLRLGLLDNPDFKEDIAEVWRNMASYYVMISGGKGVIRSLAPLRDPLVWYRLDRSNLINLALGLKRLSKVLFRAGAVKVYPSIRGFNGLAGESEIHKMPNILNRSTASLMTIHLMGSCPMGEDRTKTAVDSYGQVHGAPGLFVSDASLIGNELGVNPQGTVMALARRNAHGLLDR